MPRIAGAITNLTEDLAELGLGVSPESQVLRLAALAESSGLDGVVCSPREAAAMDVRSALGRASSGFSPVTR